MVKNFVEKNEEFFVQFGKILLKHQRDVARVSDSADADDQAAQNFARYLRAARANAGLSTSQLADKANIPQAVMYALERGLIFSKSIQANWLHRLAEVLDEDIEIFALLLDCDIPAPGLAGVPVKAKNDWRAVVAYFGSMPKVLLAFALMILTFLTSVLCMSDTEYFPALAGFSTNDGSSTAMTSQSELTISFLPSEQLVWLADSVARLGIALSLISVLLLLLLWIAINNENLLSSIRIIRTARWQRKLIYATPLLLICISLISATFFAYQNTSVFAEGGTESQDATESTQVPTFRTIDGSDNNIANRTWGQAGEQLSRLANAAYADGFSAPPTGRPNPRDISNAVSAQSGDVPNSLGASDMLWQWGQFLDHDLDLSREAEPEEPFNIEVPTGDGIFDPSSSRKVEISFNRSIFDTSTSTSTSNPRQQINEITTWIDASQVYGSDEERASWKRSFVGGRLETSAGHLLPIENNAEGFFGAGHLRANEQIGLTAMHTLFMREHNRLADRIAANNPSFTDEEIYQRARALVGAQIQIIAYGQFLDALLGPNALPTYTGYQSNVDPTISNEFSTAAYRFGDTMLPSVLLRLDSDGNEIANGHISLREAFFNTQPNFEDDIEPILRGLAVQKAQEIDPRIIDDGRNFVFANEVGSPSFDLAALNIQRGRDHGLPTYNEVRQTIGLTPANSFADITSDPALQAEMATAYGNDVSKVDLWIGGLAEDHVNGSLLGETFRTILIDQFTRLRDGDRFWHQNVQWTLYGFESDPIVYGDATGDHTTLSQVTLSDIIRWNTSIDNIQQNVFIAEPVPPSTDVIYVSSHTSGSIGGLNAADEEVLLYDEEDDTQS